MACALTKGRAKTTCKDILGGNSTIYLFNEQADPFTVSATTNEATAINASITAVWEYPLMGDTNTLEQSMVGESANYTRVNTQTLSIQLPKMSVADSAEFNILAASFAMCVVKDRVGNYHALGITDGMDWTVVGATGGAKTDANGWTITATAQEAKLAPMLDTATIAAMLLLLP